MEYANAIKANIDVLINLAKLTFPVSFFNIIISAAAVKVYTGKTDQVDNNTIKLKAPVKVVI